MNENVWVSLAEAAELERIEYKAMQRQILREMKNTTSDGMEKGYWAECVPMADGELCGADKSAPYDIRPSAAQMANGELCGTDKSVPYERGRTDSYGQEKRGYIVRYEPNPAGGKDLVYIALSSLSEEAQERYEIRIRERLKRERARKALANKQPPWYVEVDIGWYLSEYRQEYMKKTAYCSEIEKYFEQKRQHKKNVTEFCEVFAREHLDMSGKQMRRYINRYEEGVEWATLAEEEDGQNYYYYRILALCTPPKAGIHRKLTPEIMALIENLWAEEDFHRNRQSVQMLYERLEERLRAEYAERSKRRLRDAIPPPSADERNNPSVSYADSSLYTREPGGYEKNESYGEQAERINPFPTVGANRDVRSTGGTDKSVPYERGRTNVYGQRAERYEEELWIPSYKTVKRYCDELDARYSGAAALMKDGVRQWKNTTMQKRLRNTAGLQVMELWQGDAHTFDCWVEITKPNGVKTAVRPYLVAFVDTRSRCIAAWGICTQPNSEVIKKVIIHGIYPKEGSPVQGVPRVMLIDNGKDFTAQTLTGRKRTERFDIDGEIRGFYKALGIEYDMRALPYQAWTKGQIERFFGTLCSGFSKKFAGYTGTLTGSRTDGKVIKDIKGMLERGELHTMDEFAVMFEAYLEKYHEKRHSGLERQHEKNPRPIAVYENAERYVKAAPPMEYALSLLGTTIVRTVHTTGIELDRHRYMSEELAAYIGEKVTVRVKEGDVNTVICYTAEGHIIGKAYRTEELNPIADRDDDRLNEHIRSQRRQLRRTREDIEALRTPYEEREQLILPALTGEDAKVVSFVDDRQYTEELSAKADKEVKRKKKSGKERQEINEFMRTQADKAFERLKRLG